MVGITVENDPTALKITNNLGDILDAGVCLTNLGTLSGVAINALFTGYATTASLAVYAPLASPVFTGDARAVTPATSDNDTSIATTAYVKNQGYATSSAVGTALGSFLLSTTAANTYQTISGMSSYLTTSTAASTYQPTGSYLLGTNGDPSTPTAGNLSIFDGIYGSQPMQVTGVGLYFPDYSQQTTAGIGEAPYDSQTYGRNNNAWVAVSGSGGGVAWGAITGTLTDQIDLLTALENPTANVLRANAIASNISNYGGGSQGYWTSIEPAVSQFGGSWGLSDGANTATYSFSSGNVISFSGYGGYGCRVVVNGEYSTFIIN